MNLKKRLLESIVDEVLLKEDPYRVIIGTNNINTYNVTLRLKDKNAKDKLDKELLYNNEVKVEKGIYSIKQYISGIIIFGFKESKSESLLSRNEWWSSNPASVYKDTGAATIEIKVESSSTGYYSILVSDLLALIPSEYIVVRDNRNSTYARVIKREDLEEAEKVGYQIIAPNESDVINVDKVCYIQNVYSNTVGTISTDFDLNVFKDKLSKEQDFPNILQYLNYCKSNNVEIECNDEKPIFAGIISEGEFYSLKRLREENKYIAYNGIIKNYKDLMSLASKGEIDSINIVEQDRASTRTYNRESYAYILCKRGFESIKVRIPIVVKDFTMKVKEEFK